ncbi:MAG: aldehyde dehydrogenase [Actinomycetota bacterium]|jgi:aldehyde dehydrogenase (NAD+)|nr:aldehyde dehydrogenase [Actinomycetota bacterium]
MGRSDGTGATAVGVSVAGEERLLVDGELRQARSGATFTTSNPATGEVLGVAADAGPEDVGDAVAAARRAFDTTRWSTDVAFRVRCLRQLHDAFVRHADELRALTVAETGSPVSLTRSAQLDDPVAGIAWVADLAERYPWESDLGNAAPLGIPSHRWVRREATGVVGAITPWNVPHQINLAKVAPALAAGNTVVLKPAPDTPWCATALGALVVGETDIPPGVLNVVPSSDHGIGAALCADPRVDQVSFTGSTATGRTVMATAAATVKKVFLELGGKSAFVVLDDADLRGACAVAAFTVATHAGQGCAITTRLVVPRALLDDAVAATAATLAKLPAGDPGDPGTVCGPVINARQRDRIEGYLALAVDGGGEIVVGGRRPDRFDGGFWVDPALVVGLPGDSRVVREEIFGPVLVVLPHDGDGDAVAIANDSPYGLSGSVWSGDRDRAVSVANRMRTGTVGVNGGLWYSPDVPFGGYRQSGIGREMGVPGFEEYLETKSIAEPA